MLQAELELLKMLGFLLVMASVQEAVVPLLVWDLVHRDRQARRAQLSGAKLERVKLEELGECTSAYRYRRIP